MLQSLKTSYTQDISLLAHRGSMLWYGLLIAALLIVPGVLGEFYVNELGGVYIFAIAGVGLMLLTGYTGLVNLGQGAFLGIGAYTNSVLMTKGVVKVSAATGFTVSVYTPEALAWKDAAPL